MTLTEALMKFLGKGRPGKIYLEIRALNEKDKNDFVKMLEPIFPGEEITV